MLFFTDGWLYTSTPMENLEAQRRSSEVSSGAEQHTQFHTAAHDGVWRQL